MESYIRANEKEYFKKYHEGNREYREFLITNNLGLVSHVINTRFKKFSGHFEDLYQEGIIALINAVDNYDYNINVHFSSFACVVIQNHLGNYVTSFYAVHVPLHVNTLIKKVVAGITKLCNEYGRMPTNKEIADYLNISLKELGECINILNSNASVDSYVESVDNPVTLVDILTEDNSVFYNESRENNELKIDIMDILKNSRLNERELMVIWLRFGFNEGKTYTREEIGTFFNIGRERIRQIENNALDIIRKHIKAKDLAGYLNNPDLGIEAIDKFVKNGNFVSVDNLKEQKRLRAI